MYHPGEAVVLLEEFFSQTIRKTICPAPKKKPFPPPHQTQTKKMSPPPTTPTPNLTSTLPLLFNPSPQLTSLLPLLPTPPSTTYSELITAIRTRLHEILLEHEKAEDRHFDVLEGMLSAHGRLGERAEGLSVGEQAGLEGAEGELMGLNREYEGVFGGLRFV